MTYTLKEVTIRTDNTGIGMRQIGELWRDVSSGVLPILFDSEHNLHQGIMPIAKYSQYEQAEKGAYDLTIAGVTEAFFQQLEAQVDAGIYRKYVASDENGDVTVCTKLAWGKVWEEQSAGLLCRAFTNDYESSVPAAFSQDGKAFCTLYIAVQ